MPAGRFDEHYAERVQQFDWRELYEVYGDIVEVLAEELAQLFDYVLIDARTGLTDIGSICTAVLPDRLVLVFAPNHQSLHGAVEVGRQAVTHKPNLAIVPLISRLENAEKELQERWIAIARTEIEVVFRAVYGLENCELEAYFSEVRVPHVSFYSFGELIAAERERADVAGSLTEAFARLVPYIEGKPPWHARPRSLVQVSGTVSVFVASAPADSENARDACAHVIRLGIRPLYSEGAGDALSQALSQAMQSPTCRTMALCVSAATAADRLLSDELSRALWLIPRTVQIIPILLGPHPDAAQGAWNMLAQALEEHEARLTTTPLRTDNPGFVDSLASRILQATGIPGSEELVLHLGHRRSQETADVPAPWRHLPVLDMRLEVRGERDFSPSAAEWQVIHDGAMHLYSLLPRLRRLDICGLAPLGVGAIVGKIWDRGTGVELRVHNTRYGALDGQIWTSVLSPDDEARTGRWRPETGRFVRLPALPNPSEIAETLLLALVPEEREEYLTNIYRWNQQRTMELPLIWIQTPVAIANPDEARCVLVELLGAFRFLRKTYPGVVALDVIAALPMAMMPLLGHHLRQLGPVRFFDQDMQTKDYRLAVSFI